jgi:hypothetical protein
MKKLIFLVVSIILFSVTANAAPLIGRLGIGMANHLESGMDLVSFKIQRSRSSAMGGHFGMDSSADGVLYALGGKLYKYIYEEPQLNFYSAIAGTLYTYQNNTSGNTDQGYQFDGTFGSEFHFQGLESIGFSFEFGIGFSKYQEETHLKTIGHNTIRSAVHFYL